MKTWLLKTVLFKWAYRQGGIDSFSLAQKDILETMRDDLDKQAQGIAQKKLEQLLSVIDENQVVRLDERRGIMSIGSERPTEGQLVGLKAEAEILIKSDIWKVLYNTPKAQAQKAMFIDGDNIDSMKKGRSILYMLDVQNRILNIFANYEPK